MDVEHLHQKAITHVTSVPEVRSLANTILSSDRDYPVVGLTARAGEQHPAMSPERVRGVVGPAIPIYFMTRHYLEVRLEQFLPSGLCVHDGNARLWWPGVNATSKSKDHPLIRNVSAAFLTMTPTRDLQWR
jgi:hypothetical protein